jgi:Amt family ammonium transporter
VLVLMMSIPALALFYGGLVRTKNMLSVLMQVFMIVSIAALVWVGWGYSMAFTSGNTPFMFGGFSTRRSSPMGVDRWHLMPRPSRNNVYLPEYRLRGFPDDLCLHHAGADRRGLCGTR